MDNSGFLVFHDAWITPESLAREGLLVDVMTPHHSRYYMASDETAETQT
jgi:CRISPR/Cas system CMR subunit Cmr6 (Cas7 group RAMP superfamily)